MEKDFVPYEQSLALKELGFNEDCFGCHTEKKEVIVRVGDYRSFQNNDSEDVIIRDFNSYENGTVSAPLYQQAFRWFREKYVLEHKILRDSYGCRYQITKVTSTSLEDIDCKGQYPNTSYEEAELECLKKLIEMVKGE